MGLLPERVQPKKRCPGSRDPEHAGRFLMAGLLALLLQKNLVAVAGPAVAMHQAFVVAVLVMALLLALAVHPRRMGARCGGDGVFEFGAGAHGALGGKTIGSEILALGRVRHGDDLLYAQTHLAL